MRTFDVIIVLIIIAKLSDNSRQSVNMRDHWVRQIKLMNGVDHVKINTSSCVCDYHFENDQLFPGRVGFPQRLRRFAIPTIYMKNEKVWKM